MLTFSSIYIFDLLCVIIAYYSVTTVLRICHDLFLGDEKRVEEEGTTLSTTPLLTDTTRNSPFDEYMGAEDEGRFHGYKINQHCQDLRTDMHVIVNVGTEIEIGK